MRAPPLRSDAQRNRARLLAAAEELFMEQGATTSLDEVAKRAGVGIGTLYRRFATREALLAAMCDERLLVIAEASRARACAPAHALRLFLEELSVATNVYNGLAASLGTVLSHPNRGCAATTDAGRRLLQEAQETGAVRPDVVPEDLVFVVTAVALASAGAKNPSGRVSHLVDLFLNGIVQTEA